MQITINAHGVYCIYDILFYMRFKTYKQGLNTSDSDSRVLWASSGDIMHAGHTKLPLCVVD